jgi:hypothetical protein
VAVDPAAATADPAKGAASGEQGTQAPARIVPDAYEFKFGDKQTVDADVLKEFGEVAKGLKLTQEEAQKVAELGPKLSAKFAEAQVKQLEAIQSDWKTQSEKDPELSGTDGKSLDANLAIAKKALDAFDNKGELSKLLADTGFGNHPAILRAFLKIGKQISPDSIVPGGDGGSKTAMSPFQDLAARMYPNAK